MVEFLVLGESVRAPGLKGTYDGLPVVGRASDLQ